jgi:hypothetical protein
MRRRERFSQMDHSNPEYVPFPVSENNSKIFGFPDNSLIIDPDFSLFGQNFGQR